MTTDFFYAEYECMKIAVLYLMRFVNKEALYCHDNLNATGSSAPEVGSLGINNITMAPVLSGIIFNNIDINHRKIM